MITNRILRLAAGTAVASTLLLGGGVANASVNSGGGQVGTTYTQCMSSTGTHDAGAYAPSFSAKSEVGQEYDRQWVAAKLWVYNARGRTATSWQERGDPGWSPNGVDFQWDVEGLQPINGHEVYLYVQYGWYDANGWRTGGELLTSYMTQGGVAMSYCYV